MQPSDAGRSRPGPNRADFTLNLTRRYRLDVVFQMVTWLAVAIAIAVLMWLLGDILHQGLGRLNWQFLTSFPSRRPEDAGILGAITGTLWVMGIVAVVSFPLGVGAALYLEEFAPDNWLTRLIEINIVNLAGVPSIIYGLLGLAVFVYLLEPITLGRTILSGALTLVLLILPIIIVATREALRAVPDSIRLAGFALGANRWQVVWAHVLPNAISGILTGVILALSRAIGETAPLITIGALAFIRSLPDSPRSRFTVLPIQVYNWIGRPQAEFHENAAAGIIVLITMLIIINSVSIVLRNVLRQER